MRSLGVSAPGIIYKWDLWYKKGEELEMEEKK